MGSGNDEMQTIGNFLFLKCNVVYPKKKGERGASSTALSSAYNLILLPSTMKNLVLDISQILLLLPPLVHQLH